MPSGEPANVDARTTLLTGRRVSLHPLRTGQDIAEVHALFRSHESISRVHFQDGVPELAEFSQALLSNTAGALVARSAKSGEIGGLAVLALPNLRDGLAFYSVVARPDLYVGFAGETAALSINFFFEVLPLRLLYADVARDIYEAYFSSGAGRYFEVEGCRKNQLVRPEGFVDVLSLTMTRERWEERVKPMAERLMRRPAAAELGPVPHA